MARLTNRLTDNEVRNITEPRLHNDGNGLYLQVKAHQPDEGPEYVTKSWIYRFKLNGKSRYQGLGWYPETSLADARKKATASRNQVEAGIDPIEAKKTERAAKAQEAAKAKTFRECTAEYYKANEPRWCAAYARSWLSAMERLIHPHIGDLPVGTINTAHIRSALDPIWYTKTKTAAEIRTRIKKVFDYARSCEYRTGENPARWDGHFENILPRPTDIHTVEHYPSMPYQDVGDFLNDLRQTDTVVAKLLEFTILTASRTNESIGAKWEEIDWQNRVWTVPPERQQKKKKPKPHRVPLSDAALRVLEKMKCLHQSDYVFPGQSSSHLNNTVMLALLGRMGVRGEAVTHGFRSTFKDWSVERTFFTNEESEMALAHTVGNKVENSYRRSDLVEKRRLLMQAWADFCALPSVKGGGNVVALRRAE